ncbi:MAG: lipopolysaccharide kinase InaA family protein [Pseudomonadales bacterium]|nr:lipopolysaccharide kinase InaA family protein [Pseudomonadales bacterium]
MAVVNSKHLIEAKREIAIPFELRLQLVDGDTVSMTIVEIFRLLPGKRIVARAKYKGGDVLAKIFLGKTAARYSEKDKSGINLIAAAGVRSPELLFEAQFLDGDGVVLGFQFLYDSVSLEAKWNTAHEDAERVDVLTRAMIIIARLHNQGVVQTDIHLDNFLMSESRIYTIDGGAVVRKSDPPLATSLSLENLSWFFAQLFPKYDELVPIVLPAYEAIRLWKPDPDRIVRLREQISHSRDSRKKSFLEKTYRDCTRFICRSSFFQFLVCERECYDEEFKELLENIDNYISKGKLLKQGNTATVAQVKLSGREFVVKRYNIKDFWHGVRRAVSKTRASKSWTNAFHMEFLGIPSLTPVALMERRIGPFRRTAYLITEFVEGPDALTCLSNRNHFNGEVEALATILVGLSEGKISHGDLKATNFLMAQEGPIIIDLDAMREHKNEKQFERAFNRDINRFMRNWENDPNVFARFQKLLPETYDS